MSSPLLDDVKAAHGFFKYEGDQVLRGAFLLVAQLLFATIGAGYYTFPIYLNQVIADHVSLSESELSILGATSYISLGTFAFVYLLFNKLRLSRHDSFRILTLFGLACVVLVWCVFYWLVTSERSAGGHSFGTVLAMMFLIGQGCGVFYMVWFSELLQLVSDKKQFVYIATSNVAFVFLAMLAAVAKLHMGQTAWMRMLFLGNVIVPTASVAFVFAFQRRIFARPPPPPAGCAGAEMASSADTVQVLVDLLLGRRKMTAALLLQDPLCDVSSRQFLLIIAAYLLVLAMSTTFMANLGNMAANSDSEDDGNDDGSSDRDEVTVIVWSCAGQIAGRSLVPLVTYAFDKAMLQRELLPVEAEEGIEVHILPADADKPSRVIDKEAVRLSRVRNRTTLWLTMAIAVLFIVSLLTLQALPHLMSFLAASTTISVGYGMMWCVTSGYPLFLGRYDYGIVLAFFQGLGSFGTLIFATLVTALNLNNAGLFTALLIAAVLTLLVTLLAYLDRLSTEPKLL